MTDLFVPYMRPQEAGERADVRWFALEHADGRSLRITLARPSQVSLTHLRTAALAAATHVEAVEETVVHVDAAHCGLGTASRGPDTTTRYLVGPGVYESERWIEGDLR